MAGSDSDLYKDKIEVSLDGRQIFYLFFGGAVVACLVFVLGVMVGRRLEARGHVDRVAATSAARDPLAALDKLDGAGRMTYPSALGPGTTPGSATAEVDREIAAMASRRGNAPKQEAARPTPEPAGDAKAAEVKSAKAAEAKAAEAKAAKAAEAKAAEDAKAAKAAEAKAAGKAKFTLQLSAFQDRAEADSFLATVKAAGYPAYVTSADVDGKTFFRVRLGNYATYDEAVAAKGDFEKKVPKIAYVTRL